MNELERRMRSWKVSLFMQKGDCLRRLTTPAHLRGFARAPLRERAWKADDNPLLLHAAVPPVPFNSNLEALFGQRATFPEFHGMISGPSTDSHLCLAGYAVQVRRILPPLELKRGIAP